jgi:ABC-type sugar transport system ATPase subunit
MKITLENITKDFKTKEGSNYAVRNLSMEIQEGEITALLGGSGSGKSTTLNMIAGILPVSSGKILFGGQDVTDFPMEKRNVGYVFQDYLLYPNMSIFDNIAFPLKLQKFKQYKEKYGITTNATGFAGWWEGQKAKKADIKQKVEYMAEILQLTPLLKRRPGTLSGGQQQRVAIARALIKEPAVLLLDEPFSNLDARLSLALHEELLQIQRRTGVTCVYVTHNQEDAMLVSKSIAVLKDGKCMQNSSPQDLYTNPNNVFVANFIGKLPINSVVGSVSGYKFTSRDEAVTMNLNPDHAIPDNDNVIVCFRPEGADVVKAGEGDFDAKVLSNSFYGKDVMVRLQAGESFINVLHTSAIEPVGTTIGLTVNKKYIKFFDESTGDSLINE